MRPPKFLQNRPPFFICCAMCTSENVTFLIEAFNSNPYGLVQIKKLSIKHIQIVNNNNNFRVYTRFDTQNVYLELTCNYYYWRPRWDSNPRDTVNSSSSALSYARTSHYAITAKPDAWCYNNCSMCEGMFGIDPISSVNEL